MKATGNAHGDAPINKKLKGGHAPAPTRAARESSSNNGQGPKMVQKNKNIAHGKGTRGSGK